VNPSLKRNVPEVPAALQRLMAANKPEIPEALPASASPQFWKRSKDVLPSLKPPFCG
jgi:hypothetical protein